MHAGTHYIRSDGPRNIYNGEYMIPSRPQQEIRPQQGPRSEYVGEYRTRSRPQPEYNCDNGVCERIPRQRGPRREYGGNYQSPLRPQTEYGVQKGFCEQRGTRDSHRITPQLVKFFNPQLRTQGPSHQGFQVHKSVVIIRVCFKPRPPSCDLNFLMQVRAQFRLVGTEQGLQNFRQRVNRIYKQAIVYFKIVDASLLNPMILG